MVAETLRLVHTGGGGDRRHAGGGDLVVDDVIITQMRAYSYIRFSTLKQADGDSLRRQSALAKEYADKHGLELDERFTFRDLGVSAYDRSNLEKGALGLFLAAVKNGMVPAGSILLIEAFDRLTRSPPLVAVNLLSAIVGAGITIITIRDGKTYTSESLNNNMADLMMSVVLLMAAHEEVKHRAQRVKDYYANRRVNKFPVVGATAPGWLRKLPDEAGWELFDDRAESVRKVFSLAEIGFGGVAITRRANAENWPVPSRGQKGWHHTNVLKLLRQRAVLGEYQPKVIKDGKLVATGEPWPGYFPSVINEDQFLRVQAIVQERAGKFGKGAKRDTNYRNILSGMLICGTCGATLTLHKTRKGDDIRHMYYKCVDRQRNITQCQSFRARDLWGSLLPELIMHTLKETIGDDRLVIIRGQIETDEARLTDRKRAQSRLLEMLENSPSLDKLLLERLERVSAEVGQIESTLNEARSRFAAASAVLCEDDIEETINNALLAVSDPERIEHRSKLHSTLSRVIDHIWVFPDIVGFSRPGENTTQWILTSPTRADLLMRPPVLPPLRKHHRNVKDDSQFVE